MNILDLVFPTSCIVCEQQGPDLCRKCLAELKPPKDKTHEWITSLWNYRDPNAERIVRHIKNVPNDRLARTIASCMNKSFGTGTNYIIVPIPIAYSRFRERGYNQSLLLCNALSRRTGWKIASILSKAKQTKKQGTASSRAERQENMKGAFCVSKGTAVGECDILLVDDVTTTGSTLCEARKTLLAAGARSVHAITIAN